MSTWRTGGTICPQSSKATWRNHRRHYTQVWWKCRSDSQRHHIISSECICKCHSYGQVYLEIPCTPNASLSFDFKVWRLTPTAYMITSGGTYPNDEHRLEGHHPKSWVFEGSNDNCTWELLDRRDNNCDLNAEYVTCNFSINSHSKKSFRFVRLRMTGKNHAGVDGCVLSAFDVFRTISLG